MRSDYGSRRALDSCWWLVATVVVLGAAFSASPAYANEAAKYQTMLEKWNQEIVALKKSDPGATANDIASAESWLTQVQSFVTNERFNDASLILERVEAQAAYVRAKQQRIAEDVKLAQLEAKIAHLRQRLSKSGQ